MKCNNCGYKLDVHTSIIDDTVEPQDGDISICFNCGEVHQFRDNGLELVDIKYLPIKTQNEIKIAIAALHVVKK